jgi:hypothetical protein
MRVHTLEYFLNSIPSPEGFIHTINVMGAKKWNLCFTLIESGSVLNEIDLTIVGARWRKNGVLLSFFSLTPSSANSHGRETWKICAEEKSFLFSHLAHPKEHGNLFGVKKVSLDIEKFPQIKSSFIARKLQQQRGRKKKDEVKKSVRILMIEKNLFFCIVCARLESKH